MSMPGGNDPYFLGDATCIAVADKAILVELHDMDDEKKWIPQSVVHDDSEVWCENDTGRLVVKEWWGGRQKW